MMDLRKYVYFKYQLYLNNFMELLLHQFLSYCCLEYVTLTVSSHVRNWNLPRTIKWQTMVPFLLHWRDICKINGHA